MSDQVLPPPDPSNRIPDGLIIEQGLTVGFLPSSEDNAETPKQAESSPEETRLREALHRTAEMWGTAHHFEKVQVPVSFFSQEDLEEMGVPADAKYVTRNGYERTDYNTAILDSGEGAGSFAITVTEKDRYAKDEKVEPIRGSVTLRAERGTLNIGFVVPSHHSEKLSGDREKESDEVSPAACMLSVMFAQEGTTPRAVMDSFLLDADPQTSSIFKEVRGLLDASDNADKWGSMDDKQLVSLAKFFESFFGGGPAESNATVPATPNRVGRSVLKALVKAGRPRIVFPPLHT